MSRAVDELLAHLAEEYEPVTSTWKFYGKKSGWTVKVVRKKRTILYMTPLTGHFRVATAFGEKAVAAAHESDLPEDVVAEIDGARKYVEGRPVVVEVRRKKDLGVVRTIAAIKMAS